ncbi:hypothetical protein N7468_005732 [Penicillium chermesinum]|uniref:PXA domain-containing protein n=1 Tax=Penicillium chermesinum TaxID=63820 RepID=A0A9W9TN92_9EURO|nr:uncharacterized protein N7468_005732 [Penicillium chermesinum]KAJ5232776.1 hypothetical protein N7468_005732 [Penicillium chermesinum]
MDPSSDDLVATKLDSPPEVSPAPGTPTKATISKPTSPPSSLNELLDVALNFLATSSNEQILVLLGLLVVITYLVLGRIGLILIGAAGGVVLHAHWEGPGHAREDNAVVTTKRRELALEVSKRLLDWNPRPVSPLPESEREGVLTITPEGLSTADLEYATFRPETAAGLRSLTNAVVHDYVRWWYSPILPNENSFPDSCRRTLTHFVTNISSHLARKRTEDTFLQFLTNSSSIIIVFLNELAAAFSATGSSSDAQHVVEQYLQNSPDSSLANVLSQEQQKKKLNMVADDILAHYLDTKAYACPPVRDFLREVLAGLILESTVISLARPEFINEWIVYLLQDGESEIMHAIDAGVEGAGVGVSKASEDSKNALPEPSREDKPQARLAVENSADQLDKAEQEALVEAKRLSALIASHDAPSVSTEPIKNSSLSELDSNAEPSSKSILETEKTLSGATDPAPSDLKVPEHDHSTPPVRLHGAYVSVDDDAGPNDKAVLRSRPNSDYLLQVEPSSAGSTGWMVFRKYADFQSLHETLETVARLNQIKSFSDQYPTLPDWKGKTRHALARDLERYLHEAMKHESLAETHRMRRFLQKQTNVNEISTPKTGFSFPTPSAFENMGKGVLGALTNAPKGVAGGGKAVFDGVTGVFGGGHNKKPTNSPDTQSLHRKSTSKSEQEILGSTSRSSLDQKPLSQTSPSASSFGFPRSEPPQSPLISGISNDTDWSSVEPNAWASESSTLAKSEDRKSLESNGIVETSSIEENSVPVSSKPPADTRVTGESRLPSQDTARSKNPITSDETQIAVELIFAVINELYTLSSAWNIRRTLLNAAKSYILRPGSPTLKTIRDLLQDSMIESNTSDEALGEYLKKLRINALPTAEELKEWPPPPSDEEKEQLRQKARRLFVQRGIPQALTSVMGAAASREALEKIFDSLQVQTVARGFVFSLMLQGLKVLTL